MTKAKTPHIEDVIEIEAFEKPVKVTTAVICVVGERPFISSAMSAKVKAELLFPAPKKNAAAKATTLKHDPMQEFRDGFYRTRAVEPAAIGMPAACFKRAMQTAALVTPGATKAETGRLIWVGSSDMVPIFGVPQFLMSVTRSANINRTPDVRTRPILPQWAASFKLRFMPDFISEKHVLNLVHVAGLVSGLGDYRVEKGAGDYGQWRVCSADDPQFVEIMETGGRAAQEAAIADPQPYDHETEQLWQWYCDELVRQGKAPKKPLVALAAAE